MKLITYILINGLLVLGLSYVMPGVFVENYGMAVIAGIVLGLINLTIKPILTLLTLPITILTLGLFLLVINGMMVLLADAFIMGFSVDGLFTAIIFSLILSFLNFLIGNSKK